MRCPDCGQDNAQGRERCERCGKPFSGGSGSGDPINDPASGSASSPTQIPTVLTPPSLHSPAQDPSPRLGDPTGFATGTVLGGRYEILGLLGGGGMGRVYKARDLALDKIIALKTIREGLEHDPDLLQRFKQELLLARRITHKNVVRIYDLGQAGGTTFITMELIEGESLGHRIQRLGKILPDEALRISRQILGALEEAHGQGVVHRDLKPANVMIDGAGMAYILDFGIARTEDSGTMTATGALMGTPHYMSPEQVRGESVEAQSDIYSFGVILYEMLTGDLPYRGETAVSTMVMRLTHKPKAPRELNAEIPRYLESVVLRCMEENRALRHKSAGEVLRDLDRQWVDRAFLRRARASFSRHRLALAGAAGLVLVAAAAAYVLRTQRGAAATAEQEPLTTLAILPLTNTTGSAELQWLRSGLADMIVTDLSQSRYVRPLPGERTLKVLRDLGLAEQARFDEALLESISARAKAQSVLYGSFTESGGKLRLDLNLRRAGSGVLIPLKMEGSITDLFALVDQISREVRQELDLSADQLRADADRPIAEVSTGSVEARRAYQEGLARLQDGSNQAAIAQLRQATALDPDFAMAHAKLAESSLKAGDHRGAEAAIERARELSETGPLPLAERFQIHATAAWVKDDYASAAESYGQLAQLYPDDPDIELNRAQLYAEMGKLSEAVASYRRVVELAPDYGAALLGLGRMQVATGQPREAIESAQKALSTGQFDKDLESTGLLHSMLGVAYREISEHDRALGHFEQSLELRRQVGDRKGEAVTLNNMASIYALRGQTSKALEAQQEAVGIAREMGDRARESNVLSDMANVYKLNGQLDQALATYRESLRIEMERQDHTSLANRLDRIAEIYRLQGHYDDALVYLEQASSHAQQSGDKREIEINLHGLGLVKKAQGFYDEAVKSLMAALPLAEEIEDLVGAGAIRKDLGEIYSVQGRYADALVILNKALELYERAHEDTVEVRIPLAHLLLELGLPEAADTQLAQLDSGGERTHTHGFAAEMLLCRARIERARRGAGAALPAFEKARAEAEHGGRKEVLLESRIELAEVHIELGKLRDAEKVLLEAKREAGRDVLRPLEALAETGLARAQLAAGNAEGARASALSAIRLAEKFSGRPVGLRARAVLAEALLALGRPAEAAEAYLAATSTLDWIRGSLPPDHTDRFIARTDIQALLHRAAQVLEAGGRAADANALKQWIHPRASKGG